MDELYSKWHRIFLKENYKLVSRKSEFGPRALGNRSILADQEKDMKDIKFKS